MDPSIPNRFPWENVETDIHGLAQYFGIDLDAQPGRPASSYSTGSPPNFEDRPSSDHDTLNHSTRQAHADDVSPNTPGFPPTSALPQYPERDDFLDHYAIGGSSSSYPRYGGSASAEFAASQQYGQFPDVHYPHGSGSFDSNLDYGASASAEHSTPQHYGHEDYPHYRPASLGSFDSTPRYGASASAEFEQHGHNDYPHYRDSALGSTYANPLYETSASAEPSSSQRLVPYYDASGFGEPSASQQYGQNFQPSAFGEPSASHEFGQELDPFYLTEDDQKPLQAHVMNPTLDAGYQPYGIHATSSPPATSHAEEPSALAGSSHSQLVDYNSLQEIQASIAMELPRNRSADFDPSSLPRAFKAFTKFGIATVFKIAKLGRTDHNLDLSAMVKIMEMEKGSPLVSAIKYLNRMMNEHKIGTIDRPTPRGCFRFIKLENFHFVDIFCEACTTISHDFRMDNIPLKYIKIISLLYGKSGISREDLSNMLDMLPDSVRDIIHVCNNDLKKNQSPVKIAMYRAVNRVCYYRLTLNNSDRIP